MRFEALSQFTPKRKCSRMSPSNGNDCFDSVGSVTGSFFLIRLSIRWVSDRNGLGSSELFRREDMLP